MQPIWMPGNLSPHLQIQNSTVSQQDLYALVKALVAGHVKRAERVLVDKIDVRTKTSDGLKAFEMIPTKGRQVEIKNKRVTLLSLACT